MYIDILEACIAIYVVSALGMDTWSAVCPVVLYATELPLFE